MSLDTLRRQIRRQTTLSSSSESALERNPMWMKDYGNQNWISLVTVMQSLFLHAPEGEELPWVKMFKHAFQGNW